MINNVVLVGRLTAAPELRTTTTGISVARFTLAVDRQYKTGEERVADFVDCVAWRSSAEFVSKYFKKGDPIGITGSIQTRNYTDKNDNKRKAVEIVVDGVSFIGSKKNSDEQQQAATTPDENVESIDISNDDLPF